MDVIRKAFLFLFVFCLFAPAEAMAQTQPVNVQAALTASSAACATANSCATLAMSANSAGVVIQLRGTFTATVQFEATSDEAVWTAITGVPVPAGIGVTSATAAGMWQFATAGIMSVRARVSAYTSGAVQTSIQSSSGSPSPSTISTAGTGDVNVAQINAVTPLMGNGVTGTGSLRVTLASDTTSNTNNFNTNTAQINGVAASMGNGISGTGVQRVTLASDSTGQVTLATGANVIGALTANQSVNAAQIAGVATAAGSGVVTAGTLRTVLATDVALPAGTNNIGDVDVLTFPDNEPFNVAQINGVTPLMGNGITGTGSQRVTIASDNTAFSVNNTQTGTAAQNVTQFGGTAVSTGTGAGGLGIPRVTISNDSALAANQSVNTAQINGVAPTMGNGVSGTGVQRVTLASDSTGQVALAAGAATIGALTANQSINSVLWGGSTLTATYNTGGNGHVYPGSTPILGSETLVDNGATLDKARAASLSNFPVSTTLTARNVVGAQTHEKSSRWSVVSNPAAGSQATASIAAEVSVRHVADCLSFSAASTTAPALTALTINLRDGATGAGTIIWPYQVVISAVTGQNVEPHSICGLNLVGTTNTAMTFEFSASLANLIQAVSISGYNVN